jgi:hypothetical protein
LIGVAASPFFLRLALPPRPCEIAFPNLVFTAAGGGKESARGRAQSKQQLSMHLNSRYRARRAHDVVVEARLIFECARLRALSIAEPAPRVT